MKALILIGALAALVFIPLTTKANSTHTYQTVISPGDLAFTQLLGINSSGTIAGYFGDGTAVANNGFTLTLSPMPTFTPENFPGSVQTQVIGINDLGNTVGFWIDASGAQHGFMDVAGTFTSVDNPLATPPLVTQLLGINNSNVTVGYYTDAAGNFHPFTYIGGTFTAINFSGEVSAQATGINNSGEIVGFNTSGAGTEGFLDNSGVFTFLQYPGATFTQALGINDNGDIVGSYVDAMGNTHGFIYFIATGTYQTLNDPNAVGPGGTTVNGINDENQIVGFYSDADGNTDGFVGTPVGTAAPEPSSLLMLGAGVLALIAGKRILG